MSTFVKRLAGIRKARLNRVAEDQLTTDAPATEGVETEDNGKAQEFIDKCAQYGLTLTNNDLEEAEHTKKGKITPYILMTSPGKGAAFIQQVMDASSGAEAAKMVLDKFDEIEAAFKGQGYDKWYGGLSEAKRRELEFKLPNMKKKGYTVPQAIGMYIYNGMQAFLGDAVISELEDPELEKMAQTLVAEFEGRVRQMLASFSKKNK